MMLLTVENTNQDDIGKQKEVEKQDDIEKQKKVKNTENKILTI
jgi:hypothetical protein